MNFNRLLIYVNVFAFVCSFQHKRNRSYTYYLHQISENTSYETGESASVNRNKQLMRLIANTKVGELNHSKRLIGCSLTLYVFKSNEKRNALMSAMLKTEVQTKQKLRRIL